MTDTYTQTLGEALENVREVTVQEESYIRLSSGVHLIPRKVNPLIFQQVGAQFQDPPVPYVEIPGKGRKEYNPENPEYLEAKKLVEAQRSMASIDAIIALGTRLSPDHEIPETVSPLDSEDWVDELYAGGLQFDSDKPRLRYLYWVKFIACPEVADYSEIAKFVLHKLGVGEEEVAEAIDSFPNQA
jgi:hypothetical protein